MDEQASVAGVFTQNRFCAAPVQLCREHLAIAGNPIRAMLINTGNANAGTGTDGLGRARQTCAALASRLEIKPEQVLPFSTGVIMETLPVERIEAGLDAAIADARSVNWLRAAEAIMTTDTLPKAFGAQVMIAGTPVSVTGISKGAGMIRPNMATMLGFMATDANLHPSLMKSLALELAEGSFNRVTVDGDTSTNDSFVVIATHRAAHPMIESLDSPDGQALRAATLEVARKLAQAIVRDGEGATKFITIRVDGGHNAAECRQVAYAIAHSPLVKTAFFASDPNLGRILAAVGYAGIADLAAAAGGRTGHGDAIATGDAAVGDGVGAGRDGEAVVALRRGGRGVNFRAVRGGDDHAGNRGERAGGGEAIAVAFDPDAVAELDERCMEAKVDTVVILRTHRHSRAGVEMILVIVGGGIGIGGDIRNDGARCCTRRCAGGYRVNGVGRDGDGVEAIDIGGGGVDHAAAAGGGDDLADHRRDRAGGGVAIAVRFNPEAVADLNEVVEGKVDMPVGLTVG